ncbi:MAG: zinc ribbon domain-containing protein [Acutalibacteraceae bacterium]|nr:zinc ribbon domain-containing protein [Acutalibacteraceae bacterium]
MIICPECGTQVEKGICLCPNCGEEMLYNKKINYKLLLNSFSKEKMLSAISYIGFLWIVPLIKGRYSELTMFHINQGISLLIAEIIYGIFYFILKKLLLEISIWLYPIIAVAGIAEFIFIIFAILGITSAINGEKRELPIIGGIKILKQHSYTNH